MSDADITASQLSHEDSTLLLQLQRREPRAIERIESRYGQELRLFCQRMLGDAAAAEDAVQDVITACCQATAESAPRTSLRGWLYQIARRRCIDQQRRRKRRAAGAGAQSADRTAAFARAADPCTTPAGRTLKRERAARILDVLADLGEEQRSIVVMRFMQNLSRDEIVEATGLPLRTVKSRISTSIAELRRRLKRFDDSMIP